MLDILYWYGYGVAWLMGYFWLNKYYEAENKEDRICNLIITFIIGFLSWSLPIWYIGNTILKHIYDDEI